MDEWEVLIEAVVDACRNLPPAQGNYLVTDYVSNLLLTVIDFQMHTTTVMRAYNFFKDTRWEDIRTFDDLKGVLGAFPDDREGNTALAVYLWGYKLWTRAEMLRGLVAYLGRLGVRDQDSLRAWAERSSFKSDFEGRVRGLGNAVFNWLVMRQGIETIEPDVHVRRFVEGATGVTGLSDERIVALVVEGPAGSA